MENKPELQSYPNIQKNINKSKSVYCINILILIILMINQKKEWTEFDKCWC